MAAYGGGGGEWGASVGRDGNGLKGGGGDGDGGWDLLTAAHGVGGGEWGGTGRAGVDGNGLKGGGAWELGGGRSPSTCCSRSSMLLSGMSNQKKISWWYI